LVWSEVASNDNSFTCMDFKDTDFPQYFLCYYRAKPVDCIVSEWTAWDACSSPCGRGSQTRTRTILTPPFNGGKSCPADLLQRQVCEERPCGEMSYMQLLLGWLSTLVLIVGGLGVSMLLIPLPGGFRMKFIDFANRVYDSDERVLYGVAATAAILTMQFAWCVWTVFSFTDEKNTADVEMEQLSYNERGWTSGMSVIVLLLFVRIQALLKHYAGRTATATGGAGAGAPTGSDGKRD